MIGAIAVLAAAYLVTLLVPVVTDFPGPPGPRSIVVLSAAAVGAVGLTLLAMRDDVVIGRFFAWMPWTGLVLLVVLRLVAILFWDAPIASDPGFIRDLAIGVVDGTQGPYAHRPMGYSLVLAVPYSLFGTSVATAEITNLVIALGTGIALYGFTRTAFGPVAAGLALTFYAVSPAQVLLTLPTLTETMYAGLLLAGAWVAASRRDDLAAGALAGLLVGLSQWVRPLSQFLLFAFVAVPFVAGYAPQRVARFGLAAILFFVVAVGPIVAFNVRVHGDVSVSSSAYGGWSVFVGANQEKDGRHNVEDGEVLVAQPGDSWWDRSKAILPLGIARITDDPIGFAGLVARKFWVLWADERYGVVWALRSDVATAGVMAGLSLASQAAWVLTLLGATAFMLGQRRRPEPATLLVAMLVLLVAAMHVFVEVQARYHAYLVPFLIALAAAWVARRGWATRLESTLAGRPID